MQILLQRMNNIHITQSTIIWGIYLMVILFLTIRFFPKKSINLYQERGKSSLWILISLGMFTSIFNFSSDLIFLEATAKDGFSGLWLLSSGIFAIGFSPILFGPFWSKLKLSTENEFCVFRYSGTGAKALQIFRATYLGFIVVPILISFQLLAFQKFTSILFGWTSQESFYVTISLLGVLLLKNSFSQEVRINTLNGFIQLSAMFLVLYFSLSSIDIPLFDFWKQFKIEHTELIKLVPQGNHQNNTNDLWVFLLIQWWSISILDNSNINAHRFMSISSSWKSFLAIFLPTFIFLGISFIRSIVFDSYVSSHPNWIVNIYDSLLGMYTYNIPLYFKPIIALALLLAFITSLEELFNWGSSMLNYDLYKGYINTKAADKHYKYSGYLFMFILLLIGSVISIYQNSFLPLIKFFFSISAGVGPVFIARWFWWRVNAWSQLSAMLCSLVYTLIYDFCNDHFLSFKNVTLALSDLLNISDFYTKLIILTLSVIATWVTVAYLCPSDKVENLKKFYSVVKPGGIWPWDTRKDNKVLAKKILWVILFAIANFTIVLGGWILKFQNHLYGLFLIVISILIFFIGVVRLKRIIV